MKACHRVYNVYIQMSRISDGIFKKNEGFYVNSLHQLMKVDEKCGRIWKKAETGGTFSITLRHHLPYYSGGRYLGNHEMSKKNEG